MGLHDDAGCGAIDAGMPGSLSADLAVLKCLRILAEVPDVSVLVLREIIEGILFQNTANRCHVSDDGAGHAINHLGVASDLEIIDGLPVGAQGHEGRPRFQGHEGIIDERNKVGRIDCSRCCSAVLRKYDWRTCRHIGLLLPCYLLLLPLWPIT